MRSGPSGIFQSFFLGRLGKDDSIQSMYSSTVIVPSLHSSRLVIAWYFHCLKSSSRICFTLTRAE